MLLAAVAVDFVGAGDVIASPGGFPPGFSLSEM